MSDSLGQGFTASIVNSAANYVSSDRSTLGMADGLTGAIQYVKLVWGGSGEAKFVSEAGTDPSALPVSLNNADNYWLINSVIDTVHRAPSGATAFRVAVDGSGLCFAGACFGNITIGAAISIAGFCAGATNANFGVTFGTVGITAPNGLRVRNFLSGAGVVEPLQVTGGVYGLGGTFAISNALSVDLSAGVTIMGVRAGFTMPVSIGAGGLSLGSDQIVTRINSIASGITIGVALTTPGGTFFPGAYQGIPVFGVTGQTPVGVTFSGNIGVTFSGTVGVTFTGSFTTDLSAGVTIVGTRSGLVLGTTTSGPIEIVASSLLGITQNGLLGVTFGKIGFDTASGMGVSISDVGLSGNALLVAVVGAGLCLGTVTLTATQFGVYGLSGATAIAVTGRQGSTFGMVMVNPTTGLPLPNSKDGIPVFGVSGATAMGTTFGSVNIANDVKVSNTLAADSIPVKVNSWTSLTGTESLINHLKGLTVSISGFSAAMTIGATLGVFSGSTYLGVFLPSTGIPISTMPAVTIAASQSIAVKGEAASLTTDPVGVSLTGLLAGLSGFGSDGALIGITFPSVGLSGDALKVAISGAGLCLGSISVSVDKMGVYGLSGGTAVNISQIEGSTLATVLTDRAGNVLGHSGSAFIGFPVHGVIGATALGVTFSGINITSGYIGVTFPVSLFKIHPVKADGSAFNDAADGFPIHGVTSATPVGITGSVYINGGTLGIAGGTITISSGSIAVSGGTLNIGNTVGVTGTVSILPYAYGNNAGSTLAVVLTNNLGFPLGMSGATVVGLPVFGVSGATAIGVTFGSISSTVSFPSTGITIAMILGISTGANIGISGGTLNFIDKIGGICGGTLDYIKFIGGICGGTLDSVGIRPFAYGSSKGSTLGIVFTHPTTGIPFGISLGGATQYGIPVFGISGAQTVGITFDGSPSVTFGKVMVVGNADFDHAIGITFLGPQSIAGDVAIINSTGSSLSVIIGGTASIRPFAYGNNAGSTLAVVLTNTIGFPLGMSGATLMGVPVFGVIGATALGVTFAGISLSGNVGTTFGGVTFSTVKTVIVGSAFADGGNNLGVPVYGVAGATSVKVEVVGGTLTGIFLTEGAGITVLGVSSGIPVFGVSGATAIGVTFGGINTNILFPTTGITIAAISSGVTFGITGGVRIDNTPAVTLHGDNNTVKISGDVGIVAGTLMTDNTKLLAGTAAAGIIVTTKGGNQFMWGLTIGPWLGVTTGTIPFGADIIGACGGGAGGTAYYYFKPNPLPATYLYNGPGIDGSTPAGITAVPLKQGLHIQLTKWDAISHVLIGYTAPSQFEFLKNAQVLHKEYQVAPVWGNALDQFRRFTNGATAAAILAGGVEAGGGAIGYDRFGRNEIMGLGNAAHIEPKTFMGVIEKPSRIFVPTNDAGLVYILPKAEYFNHTIGSGFWNEETGIWTSYTLYERSHYASEMHGFSGGEPDLDSNGVPGASGQYNTGDVTGRHIETAVTGVTFQARQADAIGKILASYGSGTPFIRMWGY